MLWFHYLNGKWKLGNGKWKLGNGKWKLENGKWKLENGSWKLENGNWKLENGNQKREVAWHLSATVQNATLVWNAKVVKSRAAYCGVLRRVFECSSERSSVCQMNVQINVQMYVQMNVH